MGNVLRTYANMIAMEIMSDDYFGYHKLIDEDEDGDVEMIPLNNNLTQMKMVSSINVKKWDDLYEATILKNNRIRLK